MATTTTTSNSELIRWAFDRLNARDVDALRPYWTEDTVERFPDRTCTGADEIAAYFQALLDALPDFHMEIVAMAEQDDSVFVRWRLTGTHSGAALQGLAPSGKAIALDGIDHFTVRDGVVVSNFVVTDQMDWGRQLGLLPPVDSPAERAMKAAFNTSVAVRRRFRR